MIEQPRDTGGRFGEMPRAEEDPDQVLGDPPVTLKSAMGDDPWLRVDEEDFDRDYGYEAVYVAAKTDGSGYAVAAQKRISITDEMTAHFRRQQGAEPGSEHADVEAWMEVERGSNAFLRDNADGIKAWVKEAYGVEMTASAGPEPAINWDDARLTVYGADLEPDARTDEVLGAADSEPMRTLVDDIDNGTFIERLESSAPTYTRHIREQKAERGPQG